MTILNKFIVMIRPIKKMILNFGLIFIGTKSKIIKSNKKIIFSKVCVNRFFLILSLFKMLSII